MAVIDLRKERCRPCEGGVTAMTREAAGNLMSQLDDAWSLADDGLEISRDFEFKDFHQTMAFVNAVTWIAHREDHHPDLELGYGHCRVRFSTHAVGGLSQNDFICAAKVDNLLTA
jgi:4a-hydroxytetrahydrobiopterin dehydratase